MTTKMTKKARQARAAEARDNAAVWIASALRADGAGRVVGNELDVDLRVLTVGCEEDAKPRLIKVSAGYASDDAPLVVRVAADAAEKEFPDGEFDSMAGFARTTLLPAVRFDTKKAWAFAVERRGKPTHALWYAFWRCTTDAERACRDIQHHAATLRDRAARIIEQVEAGYAPYDADWVEHSAGKIAEFNKDLKDAARRAAELAYFLKELGDFLPDGQEWTL